MPGAGREESGLAGVEVVVASIRVGRSTNCTILEQTIIDHLLPSLHGLDEGLIGELGLAFGGLVHVTFAVLVGQPHEDIVEVPAILGAEGQRHQTLGLEFLVGSHELIVGGGHLDALLVKQRLVVQDVFGAGGDGRHGHHLAILVGGLRHGALGHLGIPAGHVLVGQLLHIVGETAILFHSGTGLHTEHIRAFAAGHRGLQLLLVVGHFRSTPPVDLDVRVLLLEGGVNRLPLGIGRLPGPEGQLNRAVLGTDSLIGAAAARTASGKQTCRHNESAHCGDRLLHVEHDCSPYFPCFSYWFTSLWKIIEIGW